MGFLDMAKDFVGGKGMATVTIPIIERQPADAATFPVTDSVLKGTMVITGTKPCVLLATKYELYLRQDKDGVNINHYVASSKDPDPNVTYGEGCLKMPCDVAAGQVITHPFMVMDVDLPKVLAATGFADPNAAVGDSSVKLIVKCIADVKGSPFDPCAEVEVKLTPGH